jgi:hypothetical protein
MQYKNRILIPLNKEFSMHSWLNKPLIAALLLSTTVTHHMYSAPTVPAAVGYKAVQAMSEAQRLAEAEQLFIDLFDASKPTSSNPQLAITAFLARIIDLLKDIPKYNTLCTKLTDLKQQFRTAKWYGNIVSWISPEKAKCWDAKGKARDLALALQDYASLLSPKTKAVLEEKVKTEENKTAALNILADRIEQCPIVRKVIKL